MPTKETRMSDVPSQENLGQATECISQVSSHRKTGSHKVPERLQLFKEGLSGKHYDSTTHSVAVGQPVVEPIVKTLDDLRMSSEESTDLPSISHWSKRPNTRKPSGKHKVSKSVLSRSRL